MIGTAKVGDRSAQAAQEQEPWKRGSAVYPRQEQQPCAKKIKKALRKEVLTGQGRCVIIAMIKSIRILLFCSVAAALKGQGKLIKRRRRQAE